ncbi:Glu/Leu/Phe/Val dehydrogenase dimerization domain-containing protein [Polyangium jinanense]|uniref:Glu/Leu/Phe/Val dehydrogenase n=1 Tax=Polyangium jinanense TaxID=2829994 RepID=A0A9X3XE03_9BACT|nr:Glu/Leu/Phe/Val dehydrogenase dimerization domain-containing protein [Polyangium jinanense]MDC3960033.1 Glu/Leu/Phe/Val dehydrogenase [Polyangium jinanense]MDC3986251.1 Glu/Leu/Phe/Val dehydrogenase [Polyangium jinanense]
MEELFATLAAAGGPRCMFVADPRSGLRAIVALDDTTLGPAVGGVRTMRYPSSDAALADVLALARAMTRKCSLAGLDAGGGKAVVLLADGLDRKAAFARLGQVVEELGGVFRTAGDLGTTAADLAVMAEHTRHVHTDERGLAAAVARGLVRCIEACAAVRGVPLEGLSVAVQGAGAIGARAAEVLAEAGLRIVLADVDARRAEEVARKIPGARVTSADRILVEDVDIVAPCAVGGVVTAEVVHAMRAWAVCGAANNALASPEIAGLLAARGVLHVPDPIASAGAVIDGIGLSVMGLPDRTPLIDRLGETARLVLDEAKATGRTPMEVAEARALARIAAAKGEGPSG